MSWLQRCHWVVSHKKRKTKVNKYKKNWGIFFATPFFLSGSGRVEKEGWLVGWLVGRSRRFGSFKILFFFVRRPQKVAKKRNFLPTYLIESTQNMRSNLVAGNTFLTSASQILLACQLRHAASTLLMLSSCRECRLFFPCSFFSLSIFPFFPCLPKVLPARGASASVRKRGGDFHAWIPACSRDLCLITTHNMWLCLCVSAAVEVRR